MNEITTTKQSQSTALVKPTTSQLVQFDRTTGNAVVKLYGQNPPTAEQVMLQIRRLRQFFDISSSFEAEFMMCIKDNGYADEELTDMITNVIRNHKYNTIKIADITGSILGDLKLVSGFKLMNMPTERKNAEYFKVCIIDNCIYYVKKEDIYNLTEFQKEKMRKIYRENFMTK